MMSVRTSAQHSIVLGVAGKAKAHAAIFLFSTQSLLSSVEGKAPLGFLSYCPIVLFKTFPAHAVSQNRCCPTNSNIWLHSIKKWKTPGLHKDCFQRGKTRVHLTALLDIVFSCLVGKLICPVSWFLPIIAFLIGNQKPFFVALFLSASLYPLLYVSLIPGMCMSLPLSIPFVYLYLCFTFWGQLLTCLWRCSSPLVEEKIFFLVLYLAIYLFPFSGPKTQMNRMLPAYTWFYFFQSRPTGVKRVLLKLDSKIVVIMSTFGFFLLLTFQSTSEIFRLKATQSSSRFNLKLFSMLKVGGISLVRHHR